MAWLPSSVRTEGRKAVETDQAPRSTLVWSSYAEIAVDASVADAHVIRTGSVVLLIVVFVRAVVVGGSATGASPRTTKVAVAERSLPCSSAVTVTEYVPRAVPGGTVTVRVESTPSNP